MSNLCQSCVLFIHEENIFYSFLIINIVIEQNWLYNLQLSPLHTQKKPRKFLRSVSDTIFFLSHMLSSMKNEREKMYGRISCLLLLKDTYNLSFHSVRVPFIHRFFFLLTLGFCMSKLQFIAMNNWCWPMDVNVDVYYIL